MAWIDEKLGGSAGDHDVRLACIDADVAPAGSFSPHSLGQLFGVGEGLAEY
jgi:hypothetical protein